MWFCPTFQRPERLAELALSWEKHEPNTPLHVRVCEEDPRRDDYLKWEWPESWLLTVYGPEWTADALNWFYDWNPNQDFYGFIADDIVLRTTGGLKVLSDLAVRWYMSYPNDGHWRHALPTHFCVGGDLVRTLGFWVPRNFQHNGIDLALMNLTQNCGLLRYCPEVVFHHKHFLMYDAIEKDATYKRVYPDERIQSGYDLKEIKWEDPANPVLNAWLAEELPKLVYKVRKKLMSEFEDKEAWEFEDAQLKELGLEVAAEG